MRRPLPGHRTGALLRALLVLALVLPVGRVLAEGLGPAFKAFVEVVAAVRDRYLDTEGADAPGPLQDATAAYLAGLGDPATRYLSPAEWQNLERSARGAFEGFGMVVAARDGELVIERTYPDSPAARAGLRSGDCILGTGSPPSPVSRLAVLREILATTGPRGILLALRRQGREFRVELRKAKVHLPSVEDHPLEGNLHYIRVHSFTERSAAELLLSLERARGRRGVVLDLRQNAGGVLDAAVQMSGLLVGPGPVTWIVDRTGHRELRRAELRRILLSPPAVCLVDGGTASAAEVLAARLRRAGSVLLGTRTYGKGSIQEVLPLADGGAAVFTVARYEVVPGEPLPDAGLAPDRAFGERGREDGAPPPFPPAPAQDPALARALEMLLGTDGRSE